MIGSCHCGATWHQRGNQTGHCSGCHRTFASLQAFDRHQSTIAVQPYTVCHNPGLMARDTGEALYEAKGGGPQAPRTVVWALVPSAAQQARFERLLSRDSWI